MCPGGEPHDGVLYVANKCNGAINTESQYPYTSGKTGKLSRCSPQPDAVNASIAGYVNVTHGDEQALMEATYRFPIISVGIDASDPLFQ